MVVAFELAAGVARVMLMPAAGAVVVERSAVAAEHVQCRVVGFTPEAEPDLQADVCARSESRKRLGVLLVHGGGGVMGDRTAVRPWARRLLDAGYVTMAINYRLFRPSEPGPVYPRQEIDVKHAVRWMRDHATELGIDRVVLLGSSHGAALGATALVSAGDPAFGGSHTRAPDRLDGFVGLYGYYDGFNFFPRTYYGTGSSSVASIAPVVPTDAAHRASGPALLIHGERDAIVPMAQSTGFAAALQSHGMQVHVELVAGAAHTFDHTPLGLTADGEAMSRRVVEWLDRTF